MKASTRSRHRRGRAADVIIPPRPPCPAAPMPRFLGTWPVPGFSGVRATTCPRCQTAGFVEAGLSGAGGFRLGLADGLLADVVGVCWGPGGFVLGGGAHADGAVRADGARASGPTQRWRPRAASMPSQGPWPKDQLSLVQRVECLSRSEAERSLPGSPPRRLPRSRPEPARSE